MGFLFFNANPASVYMGDTGSMALGGAIAGFALVLDIPFYLPLLGGIFMVEALSVIIQTVYFRKTGGKRIFLMSPIHHHFELKGYKEPKIVTTFSPQQTITDINKTVERFSLLIEDRKSVVWERV